MHSMFLTDNTKQRLVDAFRRTGCGRYCPEVSVEKKKRYCPVSTYSNNLLKRRRFLSRHSKKKKKLKSHKQRPTKHHDTYTKKKTRHEI